MKYAFLNINKYAMKNLFLCFFFVCGIMPLVYPQSIFVKALICQEDTSYLTIWSDSDNVRIALSDENNPQRDFSKELGCNDCWMSDHSFHSLYLSFESPCSQYILELGDLSSTYGATNLFIIWYTDKWNIIQAPFDSYSIQDIDSDGCFEIIDYTTFYSGLPYRFNNGLFLYPSKADSLIIMLITDYIRTHIKFTSGCFNDLSDTCYRILYKEYTIDFVDTAYAQSQSDKWILYLNETPLKVQRVKNNQFDIDSIEMHLNYSESEFYAFKNDSDFLLVVSHPMNWGGLMEQVFFYQLINLREGIVFELIR